MRSPGATERVEGRAPDPRKGHVGTHEAVSLPEAHRRLHRDRDALGRGGGVGMHRSFCEGPGLCMFRAFPLEYVCNGCVALSHPVCGCSAVSQGPRPAVGCTLLSWPLGQAGSAITVLTRITLGPSLLLDFSVVITRNFIVKKKEIMNL